MISFMCMFFSLSIVSGVSNRNKFSCVSLIALNSLGKRLVRNPWLTFRVLGAGKLIPSLKSESMAVKQGNPRSASMIAVSKDCSNACNTEYIVLAENVNSFISENFSSLGTYTLLLLFSDNGSTYKANVLRIRKRKKKKKNWSQGQ